MHRMYRALFWVLILFSTSALADIRIATWNIERLGHGNNKSYPALALIGSQFDFIAVQEAMNSDGLSTFKRELEKRTGQKWQMMYSHRIGRGSYKEKYAFVWRDSAVEYVDGAVVYLDNTDRYAREPYSARFRSRKTGTQFVAATAHILYGKSVSDRTPEIQALAAYWEWLSEVYPGTPRVLLGDFNLAPSHNAWRSLKASARPAVTHGATTVSSVDGRFANLYDNIWLGKHNPLGVTGAGIFNGPRALGWSHKKFRKHASDHVPVYITIGNAQLINTQPTSTESIAPPAGTSHAQRSAAPIASRASAPSQNEVRGNRNSQIFHLPHCPSYNRIAEHNRVPFASKQAARDAGYRIAGNC